MKLSFTGTKSFTEAIALTQVSQGCNNSSGPTLCTVTVALPTGTYAVSVATYDRAPSGGSFSSGAKLLSTASNLPLAVKLGKPNTLKVTLDGVPAALAVSGIPSGIAGTAFSALGFTVVVNDAGGYTIVGTYDSPVTLSDSDESGATSIATSGSDKPAAGKLLSSNDSATLSYSGLAIAPATIGASATGVTNASAQFAPALNPIVFTGHENYSTALINLYADANDSKSTGLSAAFTATEAGWTNAPYNRSITATPGDACNNFSNTSPASGTSFTTTASLTPTPGSCTLTLSDGNGQTLGVSLSYAASMTTISTTGSTQQFTVPAGVTRITVTANGAQGGTGYNGLTGGEGGSVTGTIAVTPGQVFDVVVGGKGGAGGNGTAGAAGTNGGGGGAGTGGWGGGGGGGESTFALSGTLLFVAGGGGGSAGASSDFGGTPGGGGGTSGQAGGAGDSDNGGGGGGGGGGATPSTGGTGGTGLAPGGNGGTGTPNTGGAGGPGTGTGPNSPGEYGPGGGGAGYFGGGGGGSGVASGNNTGGSGGGGSSFAAGSVFSVTNVPGTQSGDGVVIIAY